MDAGPAWRIPAVFAALMLLFWSGLYSLYPTIGWVDPGLYVYWFLNAGLNATLRVQDYHGARLSYVVPGVVLYRIFEPMTAQLMLVSGYFLAGLIAVRAIAACFLQSARAQALVLVVIGANPLWIATFARGYVDGPCMALGLGALALLLRREPPGAARHAMAGALLVLAFCAHTLGGGMAGMTAIAVGLIRATSWRGALLNGGAAVLGALACLAVAGLVAMALGMPFLFLRLLLTPLQLSLDGTYDAFATPILEWLPFAPRLLIVPAIFILLAAAWRAWGGTGRQGLALAAAVLVPLLPLCAWFLRSASLMQYSFYAGYLFLSLVPALVLFARRAEPALEAAPLGRIVGLGATMLLVLVCASFLPLELRAGRAFAWGTWIVAGAAMLLATAYAWRTRLVPAAGAMALGLTLAGALNADTAKVYRVPGGPDNAAQHMGMQRLHAFLRTEGTTQGHYLLWFGRDAFTNQRGIPESHLHHLSFATTRLGLNALDSLAASLGWHTAAIGFSMPGFDERWGLDVAAMIGAEPANVITLCADLPQCEDGFAALREVGFVVVPRRQEMIAVAGMPAFTVALVQARAPLEEALPRRAQLEAILARLAHVDEMEAGAGQPLTPEQRAVLRSPQWRALPAVSPQLEEITCTAEGTRLDCRVLHHTPGGGLAVQRLVFVRIGPLAWLEAAPRPEAAAPQAPDKPGVPPAVLSR